ncbi:hypothetical protein K501DRAFT_322450 [Backusella circina FSU 941]|nr:hypothetical protein K501DRAFT_322450 [Backusella circina FSU 941]
MSNSNPSLPYEIVHCSSWDDDYEPEQLVKTSPGNQLEPSSTKYRGWQTPKFPEYPQDIILHLLSGPARISKVQILSHHFKIATKIDVYIGLLKEEFIQSTQDDDDDEEEDNALVEFTRLGYVCFDNNARAQFRARELKSIKINADGEYVRLVIRNCHRNRLNAYNQVGILALNVLGQPIQHGMCSKNNTSSSLSNHMIRHPFDDNSVLSSSTRRTSVSSSQSVVNRLSSSGVVEIELQQWTSALFHAEEEAVKNEAYQTAKTYKYLGDKFERFTKILSDLEIGKRHAVDTKDYDEAEKIKDDIKEIKQAAEIMLKDARISITSDGHVVPMEQSQLQEPDMMDSLMEFDDKPMLLPERQEDTTLVCTDSLVDNTTWPHTPDQNFLIQTGSPTPTHEIQHNLLEENIDPDTIPEPIMDEERGPYTLPIQVFDEETVACILSIKAKCRAKGLDQISQQIEIARNMAHSGQIDQLCNIMTDMYSTLQHRDDPEEDMCQDETVRVAADFINATLMMIQEAVMDSREIIVTVAIATWHKLDYFCREINMDPRWTIEWIERTFSGLLKRTGDSNIKIKRASIDLVITLVQSYSTFNYALMPLYISKPERIIHNAKEAKSRVELVEHTVSQLSVSNSTKKNHAPDTQVHLEDVMAFVVPYLGHVHDEVRQAAVKLVVTISEQVGFHNVSSYIDEKLRLSLTETVKKLVDKDMTYKNATIKKDPKGALTELRALAAQSNTPEKRTTSSRVKRPATSLEKKPATAEKKIAISDKKTAASERSTTSKAQAAKKSTTKTKTNSKATTTSRTASTRKIKEKTPPPSSKAQQLMKETEPEDINESSNNENNVCIFCDEESPDFNEGTLINHYYNTCPVLTTCPMCQMITEISTLNDHMLEDCEKRHLIKECSRCRQAIPVEQWLQHTLKKTCINASDPNKIHCPLCFTSITPPNDAGWKEHLMIGEGCPKLKKIRTPKPNTKTDTQSKKNTRETKTRK